MVAKTHLIKETNDFSTRINLTIFLLLITSVACAQRHDTIKFTFKNDTIVYKSIMKADSMARSFQSKADSLNVLYRHQHFKIGSLTDHLQSMIDSLNHLKLSVEKLTNKMDSLHQVLNDQFNSLTDKTEDLKSKVTQSLMEIQLPPPLQENLQKLRSSIENYKLTSLTTFPRELTKLESLDLGQWQLPSISHQLGLDPQFVNIEGINGNIKEFTGKAGNIGMDAHALVSSDISDLGNLEKLMEGKLLDMEGAEHLSEGTSFFKQAEQFDSAALAEKANEIVKEVAVKAAKDHFAGKQEILQKAMQDMVKLKNKYEEVQSMAALPKRLPNPLRGKPFIERIIPAITFQVLKSGNLLLDINPMLMYRIRPGMAIGVGWNQRLPLDSWSMIREETVYGPRAALQVRWKKGIHFRLLPEIMNTTIPKMIAQVKGVDAAYRHWVGSLFVGIKKEYTVYKKIKGNTEVLYNVFDPDGLSPYGDRLSIRFGFDFPMKKKNRS